jgi:hypothetical protein
MANIAARLDKSAAGLDAFRWTQPVVQMAPMPVVLVRNAAARAASLKAMFAVPGRLMDVTL